MIVTKTLTSPHVGSLRKSVFTLPHIGGFGVLLARIAAPDTCPSEAAYGFADMAIPLPSRVPMHDSQTQARQKAPHACQVRDRSPSSKHSSFSEKSEADAIVGLAEAKSLR